MLRAGEQAHHRCAEQSLGQPDKEALRGARVDLNDVLESARSQHGLERLDQIRFAALEVGGNISIVPTER